MKGGLEQGEEKLQSNSVASCQGVTRTTEDFRGRSREGKSFALG